ncbi:MAG TPA: protamine-2 (modular protein) [Mesorhizobium sp.]
MDRRSFLTGMLGLAGAAALIGVAQPDSTMAGVMPGSDGILDELDEPATEAEPVQYRRDRHWRRDNRRHNRRHRRRVWRRVCSSYWRRGRRHVRCYRRRVWVWG